MSEMHAIGVQSFDARVFVMIKLLGAIVAITTIFVLQSGVQPERR
jgi:hypothetical protein